MVRQKNEFLLQGPQYLDLRLMQMKESGVFEMVVKSWQGRIQDRSHHMCGLLWYIVYSSVSSRHISLYVSYQMNISMVIEYVAPRGRVIEPMRSIQ